MARYHRRFAEFPHRGEVADACGRNIRAPVLLLHGTNDSLVPFAQSQMMANALQAAGKAYQLIPLDGEDHWLSSSATRIRMLGEIEKFLAANLGNPGGTAAK